MEDRIRFYKDSIKRTQEILDYVFPGDTAPEEFAKKRLEQLAELEDIINTNEAFLRDLLDPLEKKERLSAEDAAMLEKFAGELNTGIQASDNGVLLRVYRLLYNESLHGQDLNERVKYTYYYAYYRYAVCRMDSAYSRDNFSGFDEICEYEDLYDLLSLEGKSFFMRCWCNRLLIPGYSWQEKKDILDFVLQKKEDEPDVKLPYDSYILALYRNIKNVTTEILGNDKQGVKSDPGLIELARTASGYIYNNMMLMKNSPRANRLASLWGYHCSRFHAGEIDFPQLLEEGRKLCVIEDDYNAMEKSSIYLRISPTIATYCKYYGGDYDSNDIYRMFSSNMEDAAAFMKSLKSSEYNSSIAIEFWGYLGNITNYLRYEQVKPYYDETMKNIDPDIYAHLVFTTRAALIIAEALLDDQPSYFARLEGVRGAAVPGGKKTEILNMVYNVCFFHDIGLLRLLEITKIAHRRPTKEETDVIYNHPLAARYKLEDANFPKIIEEGIECHHIAFDGNGYPADAKITHKELIDILRFADDLEKLTNPYMFSAEPATDFDGFCERAKALSGSEYAPAVVECFLDAGVSEKLRALLGDERTAFICESSK